LRPASEDLNPPSTARPAGGPDSYRGGRLAGRRQAQLAELVDALVSNTCGKPCRFDSGAGYKAPIEISGLCCFSQNFTFAIMASVYILFSKKLNRFYTGSCKDLIFRIDQHLNKEFSQSFTTVVDDWELYFTIGGLSYQQARLIETHIKKMKSKIYIQNLKNYPEIVERLKVKYI
jgi:putative endonuclease